MSQQLINRNPDLKKLRDSGYSVSIIANHLVVDDVPYVTSERQIKFGRLVSTLNLAGDKTRPPDTHVIYFAGEHPCMKDGRRMHQLDHGNAIQTLAAGLVVDRSFSHKPAAGYADYFEKIEGYVGFISNQATSLDPGVTAKRFKVIEAAEDDSVFQYLDTASSKAGITALTEKFEGQKIAIVGMGGTGSYILDLIAKTPVAEIHLFDFDRFYSNNAFRAPGAASLEELREASLKVEYFARIYGRMHKQVIPHEARLTTETVGLLEGMTFVFICVDRGDARRAVVEELERRNIPFIDCGMGIERTDDKLRGVVRVTTSASGNREHVRKGRMSFVENDVADEYSQNIQIAEMNALNAALAVIRWKKLFGFYDDLEREYHSTYTIDGNHMTNEDNAAA